MCAAYCIETGPRDVDCQRAAETFGGMLSAPVLLLLGEDDRMTPPKGTKELTKALHNSETIILHGAGHMMMTEQPDQTIEILSDFFQ